MKDLVPEGRFIWHELTTTEPAGAMEFYPRVTGWSTAPWGDGTYSLWMSSDLPVGGVMAIPEELRGRGVPPNWLTYLSTPNCKATIDKIVRLGGSVMKPEEAVPEVGKIAVVSDPDGAVFCLLEPVTPSQDLDALAGVGQFSWHELATSDPIGAVKFYQHLAGWDKLDEFDMGELGVYHILGFGNLPRVGIFQRPPEVPVSYWLPYIRVNNVDEAEATAASLGAKSMVPPMEVPGGDRITVMEDLQGAVFALHATKS